MWSNQIVQGRPYGGTTILWRDNLMASVEPVGTHSYIVCSKGYNKIPVSSYVMHNNLEDFAELIISVSSVLADTDIIYVILGDDLNYDFCRVDAKVYKYLIQ